MFYAGGEEKGGKYLEKENIFSGGEEIQRRKRMKIFGEDLAKNCQGC